MKLISFGFKHGQPEPSKGIHYVVFDVREMFVNPHQDKKLRNLTGKDEVIGNYMYQNDMAFSYKYSCLKQGTEAIAKGPNLFSEIYIGCTGGHHRSVYLVERLGKELGLEIAHRDIDKP